MTGADHAAPVEWGHPLNAGLVAWYLPLPGRAGASAFDLTGRCPAAALANAPGWAVMPNRFGWLSLTAASDQYANCGNPAPLQITGPLTVAVRYRLRTAPANAGTYQLFSKDADSGGRAYTFDLTRNDPWPPGGGVRFYVNGGGGSNNQATEGRNPAAADDRWVCGTFTPSTSGGLRVYVNGLLAASNAGTTDASIPSASANVLIGRRGYAGYTEPLDGWVGDVRVYARALSAAEVANLHDQHRRGYPDLLRRVPARRRAFVAASPPPPPPAASGFPAVVVGGGFGW